MRRRRRAAPIVGAASLLVLALLSTRVGRLDAAWAGCALERGGEACEISGTRVTELAPRVLRIWTDAEKRTDLSVFWGLVPLPWGSVASTRGQLLEVVVPPGAGRITVVARTGFRVRFATRRISDWSAPAWMIEADQRYEADRGDEAAEQLRRHQADPMAAEVAAQVASLQASLAMDGAGWRDAPALLRDAIRKSRLAGLDSLALEDTLRLSSLLGHRMGEFREAERLLADAEGWADTATRSAWMEIQRANFLHARGDLRGALAHVDPEPLWVRRLQLPWQVAELRMTRARLYRALGRMRDAHRELEAINDVTLPPCRRANVLSERGSLKLDLLELQIGEGRERERNGDPSLPLLDALRVRREGCNQPKGIAEDVVALARARYVLGDPAEALRLLDEAAGLGAEAIAEIVHPKISSSTC